MFDELDYQRCVWLGALENGREAVNGEDGDDLDDALAAMVFCRAQVKYFEDLVLARDGGEKASDDAVDQPSAAFADLLAVYRAAKKLLAAQWESCAPSDAWFALESAVAKAALAAEGGKAP